MKTKPKLQSYRSFWRYSKKLNMIAWVEIDPSMPYKRKYNIGEFSYSPSEMILDRYDKTE